MKLINIFKGLSAAAVALSLVSCEDFLNRPSEDNYNVDNFYKDDSQCEQGVNYLYNSPWYDFQRGFIKVGEVMSGNMYWGSSPYLDFTTNGTDTDLVNMSYSLWAVNGHANTVIDNILNSDGPTQACKNKCIGEALTWKAFAYFFMVRTFGDVPIVHNNTELITSGQVNKVKKVQKADVYEYIIMTLEKALTLLPKTTSGFADYERIDYYAAEALLAKVYLTKAGLEGSLNSEDLASAAKYAKDVIDNSGRSLTPNYEDVFRLKGFNATGECLISWLWKCGRDPWTQQNTLQSDLAMVGFDENGDCWGGYVGPSVDLQEAFGCKATDNPTMRDNSDIRRHATMMLPGDVYDYFWTDKTYSGSKKGFDYLRFIYDKDGYGKGGPGGELQCNTGSNNVKNLFGDNQDHISALGITPQNMANQLPTHILRLSDVYLIYAEAVVNTDNAAAKEYVNKVRERAGAKALETVTWNDIWKERRLELAGEGDRWYDYVRRSYYDVSGCISELKAQKRSYWNGLNDVWKTWIGDDFDYSGTWDASKVTYNTKDDNPNVTASSFTLPFPTEDVVFNGNMASDAEAVHVDVRSEYHYNF